MRHFLYGKIFPLVFSLLLFWFCTGYFPPFGLSPPFWKASTLLPLAALTFDDGPSPYTEKILDLLHKAGVPAAFFVLGEHAAYYPELLKRMIREGDEVENHSFSHPHLILHGCGFIRDQIGKTNDIILRITGRSPRFFRPPYGEYHLGIMGIAGGFGLTTTLWSDTAYDWERPGTARIVENVMENLRPGSVILLHDGGGNREQTVEALPEILRQMKLHGYRFVRLDKLYH